MKKRNIAIAAVMVVLFAGGYYFMNHGSKPTASEKAKQAEAAEQKSVSVQVISPKQEMHQANLTYKATIEPSQEAIVSSQVSGKVVRVNFENGQSVNAGTPLIFLDDRNARSQVKMAAAQLESAKATLKKLETNMVNVKDNYDRAVALYKEDSMPKADLETAKTSLDGLAADIQSAKASIASAQANLEMAQTALNNTVIKAAFAGVLDSKNVKIGQFVSPEAVLGKIQQVSSVNAIFEIDQNAISNIKVGQKANLKLEGDPKKVYEGTISSVDLSADPSSRVFKTKMTLSNSENALRPGVFAWVTLASATPTPILTLPIELVSGNEGAYTLFVVDKGVARKKLVLLGDVIENRVEIKSGLEATDKVITTNINTLQDGDAIVTETK